jgi:transposase-like protein
LDRRVRRELRPTAVPGVDETCVRVAGRRIYLYGAVESTGATNDFHLSDRRDAAAAEQLIRKDLAARQTRLRVINVDGNPSSKVVGKLRQEHGLGCR